MRTAIVDSLPILGFMLSAGAGDSNNWNQNSKFKMCFNSCIMYKFIHLWSVTWRITLQWLFKFILFPEKKEIKQQFLKACCIINTLTGCRIVLEQNKMVQNIYRYSIVTYHVWRLCLISSHIYYDYTGGWMLLSALVWEHTNFCQNKWFN